MPETPGPCWVQVNFTFIKFRKVFFLNNFVSFLWWSQMSQREDPGRQTLKAPAREAVQCCQQCALRNPEAGLGLGLWMVMNCFTDLMINAFLKVSLWCREVSLIERQNGGITYLDPTLRLLSFFLAPTPFHWTCPFWVPNKIQPSKSQFGCLLYRTAFT